jgi:chromosome segregation ATPase
VASDYDDVPYFCMCEAMLGILNRRHNEIMAQTDKLNQLSVRYQADTEKHRTDQADLKQKLNAIFEKLRPGQEKLEDTQAELRQTQVILEKTVKILTQKETEVREARHTLDQENEAFIAMSRKHHELRKKMVSLTAENAKLQSEAMQRSLTNEQIGDNLSTVLAKMMILQDEYAALTEELKVKDQIVRDLNVRAAVAFTELTPRPSLIEISRELKFEQRAKDSTVKKCARILKVLRSRKHRSKSPLRKGVLEIQSI